MKKLSSKTVIIVGLLARTILPVTLTIYVIYKWGADISSWVGGKFQDFANRSNGYDFHNINDISNYATTLHEVMDGVSITSSQEEKSATFEGLLAKSDKFIIAVYNEFNSKYGSGDTLTQWIRDEWIYHSYKEELIGKLVSLNLH